MTVVIASAPGKAIICGEYAVLDGAPAIAAAIDRRAVVTIGHSDDSAHVVVAPGFSDVVGRFRASDDRVEWFEGADSYGLVEQVWRAAAARPRQALSLTLDTRAFRDRQSSIKLGIGSSAALAVALTATPNRWANQRP